MQLSRAQKEAVLHFKGPCMVLAGPGSGKTYTITKRIQYLIEHYKVRPEEILVITFTRAASFEMKNRFTEEMHGQKFPVMFGTFHGIYFHILSWAYQLNSSNIMTESDKYQLLRQIINSPELDLEPVSTDEKEEIRDLITEIGNVKNNGMSVREYHSQKYGIKFEDIFLAYEKHRKRMRKIDFDDMLLLCYDLFRKRPDILKKWQDRFRYIMVDEFQDINRIQYEVIKMLAMPENNLFVVGDDDQSIYMFRGASPEIMLGFEKDYPEVRKIILDHNYRSTQNIVNGAMKVISNNHLRYKKKINTQNEKGYCIHVQEVSNSLEESKYIIANIEKLKKEGVPLEQIAVLYRTGMDARTMTEELMKYQIPFYTKEKMQNIYEHFAGRYLISYARLACGERGRRLFLDVMNVPNRYISRESLENATVDFEDIRRFYIDKAWMMDRIDQFEWDVRMLHGQTPYAMIQYIRKHIGYDEYLKDYAKEHRIRQEDLFAIVSEIEETSKEFQTVEEWIQYIASYGDSLKKKNREGKMHEKGVCLMTMHGSKGLEFDTVFVIQCNEGVIPHKKASLDSELEEERRLFYVAMTRAKKRLILSYVRSKYGKDMSSSRFVQ